MGRQKTKMSFQISYTNMILLVSILLATVILLILTVHSYRSTEKHILTRLNTINTGILEQNASSVHNNMLQIKKLTEYLATDELLLDFLRINYEGSLAQRVDARSDMLSRINIMRQFNDYIQKIMIVVDEAPIVTFYTEELYSLTRSQIAASGLLAGQSRDDQALLITPTVINTQQSELSGNLDYLYNTYSYASILRLDDSEAGYLFVFIDPKAFTGLISDKAVLVETNGLAAPVTPKQQQQVDAYLANSQLIQSSETGYLETPSYQLYFKKINPINMTLLLVQNKTDLLESIVDFRVTLLVMLSLILMVAVIFSRVISNLITRPIRSFSQFVHNYLLHPADDKNQSRPNYDKRSLSLRESILTYLTGVVIVPTGIFLLAVNLISNNIIETYIIQSYTTAFTQAADNINDFVIDKEKVLKNIIYNISLQQSLEDQDSTIIVDYDKIVEKDLLLGQGRDDVFLYGEQGDLIYANADAQANTSINRAHMEEAKSMRIIATWTDTVVDRYGRRLFSLMLKINSLDAFNNIGFLQYQMPEYELESIYKSINRDDNISYLVNRDKQIVSHPDKNLVGTTADLPFSLTSDQISIQEKSRFTLISPIVKTDWYLIGHYELDALNADLLQQSYDRFFIFAFIVTLTVFAAILLAFGMTSSFSRINSILRRLRMDQVKIVIPESSTIHEVSELARAFNNMIRRNEQLIERLLDTVRKQAELENKKKRLELVALQYQINPHFLYNSFESINWLVKRDKKTAAVQMIDQLSLFLRYVAHAEQAVVPLKEEINNTRHYLEIMNIRYNNQIEINWDIDEALLNTQTIRLSLQPLIENAIYHGIQQNQQDGIIEVSCNRDDTSHLVLVSVSDNGVGMDPDQLKNLLNEIQQDNVPQHIGLHNIHSRIRLFFGQEYGLSLTSRSGIGTTVTMQLPDRTFIADDSLSSTEQNPES